MTELNCVQEHLIPGAKMENATRCECQVFYQGSQCEERIPWFDTVHYIRITYSLLLTAIVIYWCILKLVYEGKEGKLRSRGGRLSHISLYVIFLGCLANVVHKIFKAVYMKSPDYWYYSSGFVFIVKVVLASIYISLYMVATNLILSFWFSILTAKFRPNLAWRTKVTSIIGAVCVLILNPIGSTLSQLGYGTGFVLMILLPVLANAIIFVVMTSIIGCRLEKALSKDSKLEDKTRYSVRIFAVLSAFWISYVLSLGIITIAYVIFPNQVALAEIISGFYVDSLEFIVAICVMLLIDRHGGIRGLTLAVFAGQSIADSRDFSRTSSLESGKSSKTTTGASESTNKSSDTILEPQRNTAVEISSTSSGQNTGAGSPSRSVSASGSGSADPSTGKSTQPSTSTPSSE